jgi:hypothetical protein
MDPIIVRCSPPAPEIRGRDQSWGVVGDPPCPDGRPQRPCELLGFRLKRADLLQLRVVLRASDGGVCHAAIDERPDHIGVRAVACLRDETPRRKTRGVPHETDCPINVPLSAPLGTRSVIDLDNGKPLPLFIPPFNSNEPSEYIPSPPGAPWPPDD